jgi:hypothetical protein
MADESTVGMPVAKVISVWAAIGITSWTEAAAFVAFLYSCILIAEWFWKKFVKRKSCPPSPPN